MCASALLTRAGPASRLAAADADTDAEKRAAIRFDDPMAEHLAKKGPASNKPKYRGPPPPANRFNLPPGYRTAARLDRPTRRACVGVPALANGRRLARAARAGWDGVDRSNGYEKQFFLAQAKARVQAQEAHEWAGADM